jgi:hypothetical protein
MLLLTGTSDLIQVITSGTQALAVHASWVDATSTTVTPGRTNTAISTATTTTVVGSPAASTQRNVKHLSIRNKDASASDTVTVQHTDGTTVSELIKLALPAGYTLTFNDQLGWILIDAGGGQIQTPLVGRLLKRTVLTSGTSFTTGASTNSILVRMVGGGGGGAGCTSVASAASAGGGGGAGGYAEKLFAVAPNTAYTYAIGAAGTGVSGAGGNNGTASTFAVGATTVTANGGSGAPVATAVTTLVAYAGGAGAAISTNGDVNSAGQPGAPGVTLIVATPIVASGAGGATPFGAGGNGLAAVGAGNNGLGFGSGGGGAATGASTVRTGGNGVGGVIVVDEFS